MEHIGRNEIKHDYIWCINVCVRECLLYNSYVKYVIMTSTELNVGGYGH